MSALSKRVFGVLFLTVVGIGAQSAYGCTCLLGTADASYANAAFVAILKVEGVGKTYMPDEISSRYVLKGQSLVSVERVFKGDLEVGEKLVFRQLEGAMCGWRFSNDAVGKRFLFYIGSGSAPGEKVVKPEIWSAGICSGSGSLEYKVGDISYLENYEKVRGKSRVSGVVRKHDGSAIKAVADHKVTIVGNGNEIDIRTNKDGLYEIYDLLPGKYSIKIDGLEGYQISSVRRGGEFDLLAGRHFESDVMFEPVSETLGTLLHRVGFAYLFSECAIAARY